LLLHLLLGALPNPYHRDDCTNADNDAQHGKAGTHGVASQSSHCDSRYGE
jgi:hypothetical protein